MTDNPTPTLKDNSPEEVAFKLMKLVIQTENRSPNAHAENPADRKYLLDIRRVPNHCPTASKSEFLIPYLLPITRKTPRSVSSGAS